MYIAPGQGQTTPWGQMLMATESPYHFAHLLQVLKQSLWSMILNEFIHVYSPKAGTDNPSGTKFWCKQKFLITLPICCQFKKKSLWSLNFYHFFMCFFSHVYSPRKGQTTHWGQKFYDNRKAFSLCPYVASFKMISSKSDFIHIFNDFIHVYSPGARAENPLGTKFWCHEKALINSTICCKFQTNLLEFWFYTHFLMFFQHVYSPEAAQDNSLWTKYCYQQQSLVTLPICCKFQKKYLWSLILYIIFHVFIHVYSPGAGADKPPGVRIFM